MEPEMVTQLLAKLDDKQRTSAFRHLSHNNKKLRIPGFSSLEKAPIKLVTNTARTNKHLRTALYASISTVILDGTKVESSKNLDELKNEIPQTKWLGLAAYLLMLGEEEHSADALQILADYDITSESTDTTKVTETSPEPKLDKKEEKFREKYLKAKSENAKLTAELEKIKGMLQDANNLIDTLKMNQVELESKCATYLAEIDALSDEKSRLTKQLDDATKIAPKVQAFQKASVDIHVLAPNCKDILGKYTDTIPMDFMGTLDTNVTAMVEEYDEIWVFPDVVSFGTYRVLRKLKKTADDKVFIFQTVGDLVAHVESVLQTDGRS